MPRASATARIMNTIIYGGNIKALFKLSDDLSQRAASHISGQLSQRTLIHHTLLILRRSYSQLNKKKKKEGKKKKIAELLCGFLSILYVALHLHNYFFPK